MRRAIQTWWPWVSLAVLVAVAWFAYRPGLSGGFLFDDFVNLDALGNSGPVDNWRTFWRFVTSGTADPTGRPLALLSFLIDAHDWPADPAPFLRTNVLLHLANGALLFALLRRLGRALSTPPTRNNLVALVAAGAWLLHPLFVSTTLYVVQREAMLPATFVLLGLLAYDTGRMRFVATQGRRGLGWMFGGIGVGTLFAVACKGNGLILPLLAWVLEASVHAHATDTGGAWDAPRRLRRIRLVLLVVPSLLLLAYVGQFLFAWNAPLASRPWTIGQRVLTEPRVLLDYVSLLVVPRSVSTGLYNDDYLVSTGLFQPLSTLPALLAVLAALGGAIALRKRCPRLAAAVLFFLAGHVLESTTVPLELYFEHRNYLPAMLLGWPLANAVLAWRSPRAVRAGVVLGVLTLLACTTWQRTRLWGQQDTLAALWAQRNPDSSRAQATAAIADLQAGRPERALHRLEPLLRQRPHDLQIAFNLVDAACATRGLTQSDKDAVAGALRYGPRAQSLVYNWLSRSVETAAAGTCPGLTFDDAQAWSTAALHNPRNDANVTGQDIEPVLGQLEMLRGNRALALAHFNRALAAFPKPDVAARQASMLATNEDYEEALAHLDRYEQLKDSQPAVGRGMPWLHAKVLEWEGYWPFEMALLRKKLHAAIAERASGGSHPVKRPGATNTPADDHSLQPPGPATHATNGA